jgi:hypothetical protein
VRRRKAHAHQNLQKSFDIITSDAHIYCMKWILRNFGLLCLAVAVVLLVDDAVTVLNHDAPFPVTKVQDHWAPADSPLRVTGSQELAALPWYRRGFVVTTQTALQAPDFAMALMIAGLALFLGRPSRHRAVSSL